jgi:hypothetical protein
VDRHDAACLEIAGATSDKLHFNGFHSQQQYAAPPPPDAPGLKATSSCCLGDSLGDRRAIRRKFSPVFGCCLESTCIFPQSPAREVSWPERLLLSHREMQSPVENLAEISGTLLVRGQICYSSSKLMSATPWDFRRSRQGSGGFVGAIASAQDGARSWERLKLK